MSDQQAVRLQIEQGRDHLCICLESTQKPAARMAARLIRELIDFVLTVL